MEQKELIQNSSELNTHLNRNEAMWKKWKERGITEDIQFNVIFHFYSARKQNMDTLGDELAKSEIPFKVNQTRTLIFLKGWKVDAEISKKWTPPELQGKTDNMFLLSKQTAVSLEGCGTFVPN